MSLSGEWWIIDGQAHFADGDVGDKNHEAYVHDHVYSELRDAVENLRLPCGEVFRDEDAPDCATLRTQMCDWADQYANNLPEGHPDKAALDDCYDWLAEKTGISRDDLGWVFSANQSNRDLRKYGMEKLGWIRVAGNNVELWSLDQSKLGTIADGLWDAHQEDVETAEINVTEIKPGGRHYADVPYTVLTAEKMAGLREYCRTPKIPLSALDHQ